MSEPEGVESIDKTQEGRVEYSVEYDEDEDQLGEESDEYDDDLVRGLSGGL